MTKKQYLIPQVETLPLFHANALCDASAGASGTGDSIGVNTGIETNDPW